jgi:hypothetical protein
MDWRFEARRDTGRHFPWISIPGVASIVVPVREHSLDFLKVGQTIATDGVQISVVATGDNDQIKIERVG